MKGIAAFFALSAGLHLAALVHAGQGNSLAHPHFVLAESEILFGAGGKTGRREHRRHRGEPELAVANSEVGEAHEASGSSDATTISYDSLMSYGNTPPAYPRAAIEAGKEGTLKLRIQFGLTGEAEEVELVEASGSPSLDTAALVAARGWRLPGLRREPLVLLIPIEYRLQ